MSARVSLEMCVKARGEIVKGREGINYFPLSHHKDYHQLHSSCHNLDFVGTREVSNIEVTGFKNWAYLVL